MHKKTLLVSLMMVICASYAQIYKWTDSQGVIHFSDNPHSGAETVKSLEVQTYSSPEPALSNQADKRASLEKKPKAAHYKELVITQPQNEETIRNNQGAVSVLANLSPALFPGNKTQLLLDGNPVGNPQSQLSFQLSGIDRGSHTLQVQVIDNQGQSIIVSDSITLFMQRPRVGMVKGAAQ